AGVGVSDPGVAGVDLGAEIGGDVDAGMEVPGAAVGVVGLEGIAGAAEALADGTGLGPDEMATAGMQAGLLGLELGDLRLPVLDGALGVGETPLVLGHQRGKLVDQRLPL